jgi:hypothetical protein
MKKLQLLWAAGFGLASVLIVSGYLRAAGDAAVNAKVNAIADLLQKGDAAGAKKAAKELADKTDVEDFMNAFNLRAKKGIGVGPTANVSIPDGIERKIEALARDGITPAALQKEGDALTRAGFVIAAVAHVAHAKAPLKDAGKQKKADWTEWSQNLAKASEEFTAATKSASAADVKKSASKIKQNCDSCHAVFK